MNPWPSAVSVSRVALAVPFGLALHDGRRVLALAWLGIAALTDVADGFLARRLRASTGLGAYLDASADFVVVMVGLVALGGLGFPRWPLGVVIAMFVQFLLSSGRARPRYDPVGKYYGGLLFVVVAAATAFPDLAVWNALADFILGITLVSWVSRTDFLQRPAAGRVAGLVVPERKLGQLVLPVRAAVAGAAPVHHLERADGSLGACLRPNGTRAEESAS